MAVYYKKGEENPSHLTKSFLNKSKAVLFGILTFTILAFLIGTLAYQRFFITKKNIQKETYDFVVAAKEKLQESLAQGIFAAKTLSFFIQKDGSVKDFDSLAAQILATNIGIDVLQLVPGGVIRYVYPLQGNEKVIGYDILKDPARKKEAWKAINKKNFFAGPFTLKQGGVAVVGRLPVFRDNKFWGFSAVIIKLPTLLKSAGIDITGRNGYYFQLSKINPDTHQEEFFISHQQKFETHNSVSVNMPNGEWKLSAMSVNPNKGYADIFWLSLLGFLFSVIGGVFVFTVIKKPERLDQLVKMRTAALQESEEKYRSLIEQASDGIIITDLAGIIKEVNNSSCTLSGFSKEEIVGSPIYKFLPKEDITAQPPRIEDLLQGKTLLYERRILKKDGTIIDVEMNSKMAIGNTLIAFVRNITERKKAEEELKKSNERFELIAKATADAIWDHDFITNETVGNENLYNLYGFTRGEDKIDFELFESRLHPDDREKASENFQKAINEKAVSLSEEFRFKTVNGAYRNFYDRAYIKYDDHGTPIRILGVMQDITERIKDGQKLLKEKELSDSIINTLPGIFYLYDKTGKFIRWNKNFETVTGYNAEEIRQMHPVDFYDEDQKPMLVERIRNVFQKKNAGCRIPFVYERQEKIPFYYNSIAIEYEGLICIMGMGFDVTERKKIEQELLISNQQLEQKASEVKTSYAELERFAYIVSHDLQEPLRMVSSFLKLLEQRYKAQLDETAEKYIHFAVDGADRMKQLITDLLEYSRTGTNKDIAADTNMNEVMTDVLNVLENSIEEQKAVVEVGHLPVLPDTSKIQMFQLMQNLLSNALKYHSTEKLVIKIDVQEAGDQWVFSVQDNGIGIDPKFGEKIFIIFQRLHGKNEFSGTGIGLSICKKIVEKHGEKYGWSLTLVMGVLFISAFLKK